MRRDMDLIKAILLESEKACRPGAYYQPESYSFRDLQADEETLQEHCRLIAERGLANGTLTREGWRFSSLTWDGHDFLDVRVKQEVAVAEFVAKRFLAPDIAAA